MREDLKKKRTEIKKKTEEPKQSSPVETKKSSEEEHTKEASTVKAFESSKPWKQPKKQNKLENMEIEVLVPKKKEQKPVE